MSKKLLVSFVAFCSLVFGAWGGLTYSTNEWKGVDESVIERFAEEAGRPAQPSLIDTDRGDLLLFVFLLAGSIGGFIAGYYFRELFPHPSDKGKQS